MATIRLFAAARAAAGVSEVNISASTVDAVLQQLSEQFPHIVQVLPRCSFLVDGVSAGRGSTLNDSSVVDVLPPFAGG